MIKREITPVWHGLTLLMLLMIAAWARISVTMLDFNSLITSYLADDAFYYYKIAANVFNLHRITYDGEQLSNGFHPLWLALITPFYTNANDGIDFVYRVQWIMFACFLLTVVAVYLTLLRIRAGWFCSALISLAFCVHSTFIDKNINGLETSLNSLLLLLLFNGFLTIFIDHNSTLNRYIYFGFLSAMSFMVRTDNGIALLILYGFIFIEHRSHFRVFLPKIMVSAFFAFLISLPWLLWNFINFGSVVQGSGKIETIFWGEPELKLGVIGYSLFLAPVRIYENMGEFFSLYMMTGIADSIAKGFIAIGWMIAIILLYFRHSCGVYLRALSCFCMAVIGVLLYHMVIRNFVRVWYFAPVGLVFIVSISALFICAKSWLQSRQIKGFLSIVPEVFLAIWLAGVFWCYSPGKLPDLAREKSPHLVVAEWINKSLPTDVVIGSMNSGILSYLVQRKVVNLDGVVDQRSMQAFWKKNHHAYVLERGIGYLVDNDGALNIFCGEARLYTCEEVYSFGDIRNPSHVVRVAKKGEFQSHRHP